MDTLTFWQSLPMHMDPVIFRLGSFQLQWYGLMYLVAFAVTYFLVKHRTKQEPQRYPYDPEFLKNLMTWAFFGVLLGGRFGYVFFYNFEYYLARPMEIIIPFHNGPNGWQFTGISGMSYHGGLIGCFVACALYCRKYKADLWNLCDLYCPAIPLGYTFGRIANFINGELWGRVTDSPFGMVFPAAPSGLPRHPSQLYEAFFEGIVLFAILWSIRKKPFAKGSFAGLYLIGYGFFRFFIEYFREPDAQLGGSEDLFWFGLFSQGQALCAAMILGGIALMLWRRKVESRVAL